MSFKNVSFLSSSHFPPQKEPPTRKSRLSRTLSDVSSSESELSTQSSPPSLQRASFSPHSSDSSVVVSPLPSQEAGSSPPLRRPLPNGRQEAEEEGGVEEEEESRYHSFLSNTGEQNHNSDDAEAEGDPVLNEGAAAVAAADTCATELQHREVESHDQTTPEEASRRGPPAPVSGPVDDPEENRLVPMTLYLHRVKGLVLALLVEPHFLSDTAAMEEVVRSPTNTSTLEPLVQGRANSSPGAIRPRVTVVLWSRLVLLGLSQNTVLSDTELRVVSEPDLTSANFCLLVSSITAAWRPSTVWRPT